MNNGSVDSAFLVGLFALQAAPHLASSVCAVSSAYCCCRLAAAAISASRRAIAAAADRATWTCKSEASVKRKCEEEELRILASTPLSLLCSPHLLNLRLLFRHPLVFHLQEKFRTNLLEYLGVRSSLGRHASARVVRVKRSTSLMKGETLESESSWMVPSEPPIRAEEGSWASLRLNRVGCWTTTWIAAV